MISILGQNLKKIRESKNISAYRLAQISGVGNSTISQIESGKRQTLNVSTIEKLASALNVEPNQLINPEETIEYELTDFEEILSTVLSSVDVTFENKLLTETEKDEILLAVKVALKFIHDKRNK